MHTKWLGFIIGFAMTGTSTTLAQSPAPPEPPAPTPQATIISSVEMHAAIEFNEAGPLADSVLRVLPIESKYNVGVSVVRRSQVDGKTPPDAIVHDAITEVYQIIEGNGVLVTGGTLESPTPFPNDGQIVRQIIGPSAFGKVIRDGTRHNVGPGDIVVIPPRTAHGFVEINTKRIVYTLIRIDPEQILELRNKSDCFLIKNANSVGLLKRTGFAVIRVISSATSANANCSRPVITYTLLA